MLDKRTSNVTSEGDIICNFEYVLVSESLNLETRHDAVS